MHKTHAQLDDELAGAKTKVRVGGKYVHYKTPDKYYRVLNVAVQEATDNICVIYQSLYGSGVIFVRDLDIWLELVDLDGKKVNRFSEIDS